MILRIGSTRLISFVASALIVAGGMFATEEQRVVEKAAPVPERALDPALPTLWVAGDSTAANGNPNAIGWGKPLADFFDPAKINVANRARGGRSSRTFITEGLWEKLLADVKAGDVLLIQFGHNDGGAINEEPPPKPGQKAKDPRARGSLPGLGEDSCEIDNIITKKHEVVRTFGWYVRKMIDETKAKGATPIVLSLTIRNIWKDGRVESNSGRYGEWSRQLAAMHGVAFIDLSALIAAEYQKLGEEKVKALFPKDYVHTGPEGAEISAALAVAGLKALRGDPVGKFLSAKGEAVAAATAVLDAADHLLGPGERAVRSLPRPANPALPSLFLIGDSTVRNGQGDGAGGQLGWGEPLAAFFDPAKLNVVNRAVGGLSSRTYITGGHWDRTMALIKPGDVVIVQFGHNDSSPVNDDKRARGTLKGVGEETEEIDNLLTKQHEVVQTYGWHLRKFIRETRSKGANPFVCSLVPRKKWQDGKIVRSADSYAGWARQVAAEEGVGFIDLNESVARRYDALGEAAVNLLFADANTHTTPAGAELNAECVIAGLKALAANPLAPFFSEKAAAVAAAQP